MTKLSKLVQISTSLKKNETKIFILDFSDTNRVIVK